MPKPNQKRLSKKSQLKSLKRLQKLSWPQLLAFVLAFAGIGIYIIFQTLAANPASNGGTGVSWQRYRQALLSPLDGQGTPEAPVTNTTGCAWNDQDAIVNLGTGNLSGSTSNTICLVADYDDTSHAQYPKTIAFRVYAASDTLDISLSNDAGNRWHAPPSRADGSNRVWEMCVTDPVADAANVSESNLSYWPEIPGTNGGRGKIVNYTLNVTSLAKTTRKFNAYFEVAHSGSIGPLRTLHSLQCPPNDGV
jgi:hypothetical protein